MGKVQDYLEKKRIASLNLPMAWVIKSTPDGVELPVERQVIELNVNYGIINYESKRVNFSRYFLDEAGGFPYEADIEAGEVSTAINGYGCGFGDLWSWTYYVTLNKQDGLNYYAEELKRVTKKYLTPEYELETEKLMNEIEGNGDFTYEEALKWYYKILRLGLVPANYNANFIGLNNLCFERFGRRFENYDTTGRIFKIDVGHIGEENIDAYIKEVMVKFKKTDELSEVAIPDLQLELPEGWVDCNKYTVEEEADYLYNKYRFLSTGDAHAICGLVDFYRKHKDNG